ncbi:MAG: MFS transporter [Oscillospiraceae bacterium]|nr:MFS transporter [Oscillospiraceae bacterium]
MATALLAVIYIAFIGLGVPDSLFGTAWPVMYREFGVDVSMASFYSMICFAGTISSSLLSARIINRFGTAKVTAFSTAMTAATVILVSFCGNIWGVLLLAIPLGLGAGAVDTALNNYVAIHYSATHMSFLHCFYGVGVAVSPYVMSLFLGGENTWRGGYEAAFIIQAGIAVVCFASFPLWKRAHKEIVATEGDDVKPVTVPFLKLMKMPAVRAVCLTFFASMVIEYVCGTWCATYLVDHKSMAPDAAARFVVIYFGGMITGRFLSGLLATKLKGWTIIISGTAFIGLGIVFLLLPFGPGVSAVGLFLVAMGNGPVYPNLAHLAPKSFGKEISQSVMGAQLAFANAGAMIGPPLFGLIVRVTGVGFLPLYIALAFVLMGGGLMYSVKKLAK